VGKDTESGFGTFLGSNIDNADTTAVDEENQLAMLAFKSATKGSPTVFGKERIKSAVIATLVNHSSRQHHQEAPTSSSLQTKLHHPRTLTVALTRENISERSSCSI